MGKIRMIFEIDSDEFGPFNDHTGRHSTTLDKIDPKHLFKMASEAKFNGMNDLLNESTLIEVHRDGKFIFPPKKR